MSDVPSRTTSSSSSSRPARSKAGCLTCLRRKVRCDERHPQCTHCERLQLECTWRLRSAQGRPEPSTSSQDAPLSTVSPTVRAGPPPLLLNQSLDDHVFEHFDFNSSIWQDASSFDSNGFQWLAVAATTPPNRNVSIIDKPTSSAAGSLWPPTEPFTSSWSITAANVETSPVSSTGAGGHALVEHFLASSVPPILSSVEVGPRWTSTKMLLASLATSSNMVRYAMMAFSAIELGDVDEQHPSYEVLYDRAARLLTACVSKAQHGEKLVAEEMQSALVTAFFLAYSDLLRKRLHGAQQILRDAAALVRSTRQSDKPLSAVEIRLIAWLRLVDGRASSAGGDGSFLDETDNAPQDEPAQPSVASAEGHGHTSADDAIESILFDVLYSPGLAFYQRVQSIMARVSRIDPWHRSRGTVSDETEVMAIAAAISRDLHALEAQRPILMDHAVAGSLTERHLAPDIARAITKSYRTYWANYCAGHIHLHRVAYKHLPATEDVLNARATIKRIARLFDDELPTNMIWPLLMACCEEDNLEDRAWMVTAIRGMHGSATNARPIADVLEEVHRRQDASKTRADVRQTSMDLFNMSFAVV